MTLRSPAKRPHKIQPPAPVAICPVASPTTAAAVAGGFEYLRTHQLTPYHSLPLTSDEMDGSDLFSSRSAELRAQDLMQWLTSEQISAGHGAVLTLRGGYGSTRLLDHLDFATLRRSNVPVVGFSDCTALLLALYSRLGLIAIHGPSLITYGARAAVNEQSALSCQALLSLLTGADSNPMANYELQVVNSAPAIEGPLVGGNLTMLCHLVGTPWQPATKGALLFFEEVNERPFRVHRLLFQLKSAGLLRDLAGVLIGDLGEDPTEGATYRQVVSEFFHGAPYPVAIGAPFGHGDLCLPLPIGAQATLQDGRLKILEPCVS